MPPVFVSPDKKYAASYVEALREGLHLTPRPPEEILMIEKDFNGWLAERENLSKPVVMPDGTMVRRVKQDTFWLVDDSRYLGEVGVRHALTEALEKFGGHVGYAVRASERGKGYGRLFLPHALKHAKSIGLEKALITCNDDNLGSIRLIETAGGVLQDKIPLPFRDMLHRRYWIAL